MALPLSSERPLLRGHVHQEGFFFAFGACILLVARATNKTTLFASLIYSFGLLSMFGISALYHRRHWEPKPRAVMKRLDHSAIFVLIAGTFTPVCMLVLSEEHGKRMLLVIWFTALLGICKSVFWVNASKRLTAIFYVAAGWLVLPYFSELNTSLGTRNFLIILAGGVVYTVGAVFYAIRKPNLFPNVFGYHELFHVFTIIGAALHFAVIYQLIT